MLISLIRNGLSGGSMLNVIIQLFAMVFVVFCTLPIHEYAHALVATKLGDDTARLKGRLTINPMAHIDPIGALMIFLVGFGYAKPVPVNPRNFKNRKAGMALTAFAGPVANLIMALFFMILTNIASLFADTSSGKITVAYVCVWFFYFAANINVSLAVFNLIPIPPLDGSRIATLFIPTKYYFKIMQYERYIIIGVFALLFLGVLDVPLSFLTGVVMKAIRFLAGIPFSFI